MRYYDNGTHVTMDPCAIEARERDNASITNYLTYNSAAPCSDRNICNAKREKLAAYMGENPNLRYHEGVGDTALPCYIDDDSRLRHKAEWTNTRDRNQLFVRFFHAVPDLSHGTLIPNMESFLKNGIDTTYDRQCDRLTEHNFDRIMPLNSCVSQHFEKRNDAVPEWTSQFGKSSREEVRSKEYLECQGYTHNGKFWEHAKA